MTLGLKLILNNDIRRVSLHREEIGLEKLRSIAAQLFGAALPEAFAFQYTDSDGDVITVTTDLELEEALRFSSPSAGLLRLTVVPFVPKNLSSSLSSSSSSSLSLYPSLDAEMPSSSSSDDAEAEAQQQQSSSSAAVAEDSESVSYPRLEKAVGQPANCTDSFDVEEIKSAITHIADEAVKDAQSFFERIVSGIRNFISPEEQQSRPPTNDPVFGASAPAAGAVKDVTLQDGVEVPPASELIKIWRLKNTSAAEWPAHSVLRHTAGPSLGFGGSVIALESAVKPGAEVEISTRLVSPAESGRFVAHFRLQTPSGGFVGPRLWTDIKVVDFSSSEEVFAAPSTLSDIQDNLRTLESMGFDRELSIRNLLAANNDIDAAIQAFFAE